jgi:hypothetical protein
MESIKGIKRKFGVFAPQVSVRPNIPWYLRWLVIIALVVFVLLLCWIMFDVGRKITGFEKNGISHESDQLSDFNNRLKGENDKLRAQVAEFKLQVKMDNATSNNLTERINVLEDKNDHLKEELVFLENLVSGKGRAAGNIFIYHFKVKKSQIPGKYGYNLLLLQGGEKVNDFQGKLAFTAHLWQDGKKVKMPITIKDSPHEFDLKFNIYHRVEGSFEVLPDTVVEALEVKVYENGKKKEKSMRLVNLS